MQWNISLKKTYTDTIFMCSNGHLIELIYLSSQAENVVLKKYINV